MCGHINDKPCDSKLSIYPVTFGDSASDVESLQKPADEQCVASSSSTSAASSTSETTLSFAAENISDAYHHSDMAGVSSILCATCGTT